MKTLKGKDLRAARVKWNLTQQQVADFWSMDRTRIVHLENGDALSKCMSLLTRLLAKHGPKIFEGL